MRGLLHAALLLIQAAAAVSVSVAAHDERKGVLAHGSPSGKVGQRGVSAEGHAGVAKKQLWATPRHLESNTKTGVEENGTTTTLASSQATADFDAVTALDELNELKKTVEQGRKEAVAGRKAVAELQESFRLAKARIDSIARDVVVHAGTTTTLHGDDSATSKGGDKGKTGEKGKSHDEEGDTQMWPIWSQKDEIEEMKKSESGKHGGGSKKHDGDKKSHDGNAHAANAHAAKESSHELKADSGHPNPDPSSRRTEPMASSHLLRNGAATGHASAPTKHPTPAPQHSTHRPAAEVERRRQQPSSTHKEQAHTPPPPAHRTAQHEAAQQHRAATVEGAHSGGHGPARTPPPRGHP